MVTFNPKSIVSNPNFSDIIEIVTTVPFIIVSLSFGIFNNDIDIFWIIFTRMLDFLRMFILD